MLGMTLGSKKFSSVAEYNNYCVQLKRNNVSFSTKIRKGKKNRPPEYAVEVIPNAD
jgi:hypothetical protein